MPSPTTIEEFLDLVRKSGVVDEKRLSGHVERMRAAGQLPPDPVRMATQLVRDGVLTHFQAEQFLQGKWRRFTIGKYKVLERLGAGGMGSVYLCEHMLMRRRVAVKVLPATKAEDTSSLERFYREARAVAALDHPNIVRAYDIDQDDKLHFLVMEHVDGASLQEILKRTGPMEVLRAAHYIRQAALGLQHAHETAGLVHRDVKPGNILVDRNGIVKVLDMGLARFFHDETDDLTRKHDENVLGTADYLAPEQALDSHGVDIRADIYSLGATFYFCLTGRTPFAEGTVAQKLIWHQTRQPKPVRSIRPEVPEGMAAILDKMMAKAADQRYQSPQAVADALIPFTQVPIPPPPESEMPQFSLAARSSGEASMAPGGRTSSDLSPSPRKVWQVGATGPGPSLNQPVSPSPAAGGGVPAAATATAPSAPSTLGGAGATGPLREPRAPVQSPAPRAPTPSAPARPAPVNGAPRPASSPVIAVPAASASAPARARPAPAESESPAWEGLQAEDEDEPVIAEPVSSRRKRSDSSSGKGLASGRRLAPAQNKKVLWWVIGGVSVGVCSLVLLIVVLAYAFSGKPKPDGTAREPIRVGPGQKTLRQAVAKAKSGDRILLTGDVEEANIHLQNIKNLTIEGEEGKLIVWRAPLSAGPDWLLSINSTEGLLLKNVVLSGEKRTETLVILYGKCPRTKFENVELRDYKKVGVRVYNCEGDKDHPVTFSQVRFATPPGGAGVYFDFNEAFKTAFPTNRYFAFRNCSFTGTGSQVRQKHGSPLAANTIDFGGARLDLGPP